MGQVVPWAALVAVIVIFLYIFIRFCLRVHRYLSLLDALPGPKGYPIIANLLMLNIRNTDLIPLIKELIYGYGPIVRVRAFGIAHVIITDVKSIEKILSSTSYIRKSTDYYFLKPWLQEGLLTSTGSKWHSRRKILTPSFHFKILEDYLPILNKNTAILVEKLKQQLDEPVKINKLITLCTLDIICETAMGMSVNAQLGKEVEYVHAVQRISELIHERQMTVRLFSDILFYFSSLRREQVKVLKILHGFTEKIIKQRRAEYKARKSDPSIADEKANKRKHLAFLDLLIEISEKESILSDHDIREEVDTFMFEGHDTTTSALCWTMHLLGRHPDIQERVIQELTDIFGDSDRSPTHEDLSSMKYLEQVIKETLRLYPSVPAFSRQLERNVEILGYTVPAGANASMVPLILHRDPALYPDPEKFDPDRFSPDACQTRHPYAYLPFSAGPRSCIGQRFALMEEKVILSTILRNFKLQSMEEPEDITLLMELILRPLNPLHIQFSVR